jgi:signal transduction histidine kinase
MMSARLGLSEGAAVQDFAEKLARTLPATVASVALLDQPSSALTLRGVGASRALPKPPRVGARIRLAGAPWHQAVLERQEPIFLDGHGLPTVSLELNEGAELTFQSAYLVPIRIDEETVGVLGVGEMRSSTREPFTEEKRDRCRAILEGFVAASRDVWEAGRLRRQTRAMSSLLRLAQDVMGARSAAEVLATSTAEVSDWLGVPVSGILFRARPDGGMEPVARRGLPEPFGDQDAAQLLLALIRTGVGTRWPVGVVGVADDPLDPFHPAMRPGETWTRVSLPLMRADRLEGIACLYVAEHLRPSSWELEAFRRRGELIAIALGVVGALEDRRTEQRWLGRAAYHMLTEHQRTALSATVARILDLVCTDLPPRLARLVSEVEGGERSRSIAQIVTDELQVVLGPIRERVGRVDPLPGEVLDINSVVRRAMEIALARWDQHEHGPPPTVEYQLETADGGPLLARASISLVGAIVHAIENAVEAMPKGGRVRLRTARDDGHMLIAVEDSGDGVSTDLPDAFAPLVSSKGSPHLGIGLSVIRSLVSQHGGSVSLTRGGGCTVLEIRLPAVKVSAQ